MAHLIKKEIALLMVALMIIGCFVLIFTRSSQAVENTSVQFQELKKREIARNAFSQILSAYETSEQRSVFPAEFAGSYYENGKTIILVTDLSEATKNKFISKVDDASAVSFQQVEYSYHYLEELCDKIRQDLSEHFFVTSQSVDQISNSITIGISPEEFESAQEYVAQKMNG